MNRAVNNEYKYDSNDVTRILDLRLNLEKNLSNVFPIAAIGDSDHNQLETQLTEELKRTEESEGNGLLANRVVLVPYNLGNSHWVGISIHFKNCKVDSVNYLNSLNNTINEEVVRQLHQVYGNPINIQRSACLKQTDATSCGPLAVAA